MRQTIASTSSPASTMNQNRVHKMHMATALPSKRFNFSQLGASRPVTPKLAAKKAILSRRCVSVKSMAAQTEGVGKLISKVEIPAFIPRQDIVDQLLRWAVIEVQEAGVANIGCPCKVTTYVKDDALWGFTVSFLKDGEVVTDIRVAFDDETAQKHEYVGRGVDGFPTLEGSSEDIEGKNLEIRKIDDMAINENTRQSIRDFCQMLVSAINKYYAFGSCFSDDAT